LTVELGDMTTNELIQHYPKAYHMAEFGTWDSIRRHGLCSTTALLDFFEISGKRRTELESMRRPQCETITHPIHGTAIIRDQKVLSDSALSKCLTRGTPREWYQLLNRKTFFWLHSERLKRLLSGRAYIGRPHCVITINTQSLVENHIQRITLSPINSGSTIWRPIPRNPDIFYKISDFPFQDRRRTRTLENTVVELAVDYSVPDIANSAVLVEHWQGSKRLETVWSK
jgi:hypothetical protein